ncbi:MAG: NAD(+) diphosphatase [Pseudomonadales bacterium]
MREFLPGDFVAGIAAPTTNADALHILVRDRNVVYSGEQGLFLSRKQFDDLAITQSIYLGQLGAQPLYVSQLHADAAIELQNLYALLGRLAEDHFALAGRAVQITDWYSNHQFCGRCGASNVLDARERAMRCEPCNLLQYPRVAPCIIVLITNGEQLLLARNANFPAGMYSTLAGFIEPGESAEHALSREVYEEVGLRVRKCRYFGSQPWPFPHQLMLGYFAEYEGGAIEVDGVEIADAQWWHYKNLPLTPPESSISGQLIQGYIRQLEQA